MKTTALVVDDSRGMRAILRSMLVELGFDVAEAAHGKEALAYLHTHADTAVALVDWNMPEMNGLELVQAVRHEPALRGLPMMMVTTETEMGNVTKAIEAGANEYVMKPFSRDVLREKLQILGVA